MKRQVAAAMLALTMTTLAALPACLRLRLV